MFESTPILLYTQQDFELRIIQNDTVLCIKNPKTTFSLVFFYGPDCQHCNTMRPVFLRNSGVVEDCSFVMVNLKNNPNLVHISKQTKTPINYVPYILLYHQDVPLLEYNGQDYSDEQLRFFLSNALAAFSGERQRKTVKPPEPKTVNCDSGICYALFQDYTDSSNNSALQVCYLSFDNAYSSFS